jgi:hypothetical protein
MDVCQSLDRATCADVDSSLSGYGVTMANMASNGRCRDRGGRATVPWVSR